MNNPFNSLRKVLAIFGFILLAGTIGYRFIESYSWLEAFYMVVQTVSTVGFNEVKPLSVAGTWFTIALIVSSFGTFAFGAGLVAQMALDGVFSNFLKLKD